MTDLETLLVPPFSRAALVNDSTHLLPQPTMDALDARYRVGDVLNEYRRDVPAYIAAGGGTFNEYDPYRRLYNESSADYYAARRDLGLVKASTGALSTHILMVGDSKTWGRGIGVPAFLRDMMGALDSMVYAHGADQVYPDPRWTMLTGFTRTNLYMDAAANATSRAELTFTRRSNGVRIWYMGSGALGPLEVSIDDLPSVPLVGSGSRVPDGSSNGWYYMDITGLADASHKVRLSVTTQGGGFRLLGFEALHDGQAVVTVSNAGVSGTTADQWAPSGARNSLFAAAPALFAGTSARKIAVLNLGTNTSANEVANYRAITVRLRELGYSVIHAVPGGTTTTAGARLVMKRTQYAVATDLGMPLVDFSDLIGGTDEAMARGYMLDHLHENPRGERYEASALAQILGGR